MTTENQASGQDCSQASTKRIDNVCLLDAAANVIGMGFIQPSRPGLPPWSFVPKKPADGKMLRDAAKFSHSPGEVPKAIKDLRLCGGGLFGAPIHLHFDYVRESAQECTKRVDEIG